MFFSRHAVIFLGVLGLLAWSGSVSADDLRLADGQILRNAVVLHVSHQGMSVEHAEGIRNVRPDELHPVELKRFARELSSIRKLEFKKRHKLRIKQLRSKAAAWQNLLPEALAESEKAPDEFLQKNALKPSFFEKKADETCLIKEMNDVACSFTAIDKLRKALHAYPESENAAEAGILLAEAVSLCNQTVSHVVKKTNETVKNSEPEVLELMHRYLVLTMKNFSAAENFEELKSAEKLLAEGLENRKLRNVMAQIRDFADIPQLVKAMSDYPRAACRAEAEKMLIRLRKERAESAKDPLSGKVELSGFKNICKRQWRAGDAPELADELIAFIQQLQFSVEEDKHISINWEKVSERQKDFLQSVEQSVLLLQDYLHKKRLRLRSFRQIQVQELEQEHALLKSAFDSYNRAVLLFWSIDTIR
ncbi:MAG: hypothetical protein IKA71_00520 [Lentisphaeria bacterium]|nr:hypothetical protein [Lentisphaeria bacterium]